MRFGTFDTDRDVCHWLGLHICFQNINQIQYRTVQNP